MQLEGAIKATEEKMANNVVLGHGDKTLCQVVKGVAEFKRQKVAAETKNQQNYEKWMEVQMIGPFKEIEARAARVRQHCMQGAHDVAQSSTAAMRETLLFDGQSWKEGLAQDASLADVRAAGKKVAVISKAEQIMKSFTKLCQVLAIVCFPCRPKAHEYRESSGPSGFPTRFTTRTSSMVCLFRAQRQLPFVSLRAFLFSPARSLEAVLRVFRGLPLVVSSGKGRCTWRAQ